MVQTTGACIGMLGDCEVVTVRTETAVRFALPAHMSHAEIRGCYVPR